MCLAIPGKIKEIEGRKAIVEYPGESRQALLSDVPVKEGDYVMVQMGIVVSTLTKEEADASLKAWGH